MRHLSPSYRPRQPTETVLYRVLNEHLAQFIAQVEQAERPLPAFVQRELEGNLRCGRIEFGFVRQVCSCCDFERLIGLACGGRGICPSCLGRRMVAGAARLVDSIVPDVPVRQWVVSLPIPLRFALAYDAELCSKVLSLFVQEVFRWLRWTAKRELGLGSVSEAHCGAVTAIHRAGSYGNLNLHWHTAALDGVYVRSGKSGSAEFHALPAASADDLLEITHRLYQRTRKLFIERGRDWEHPEEQVEEDSWVQQSLLGACAEASLRGVGVLGEQAGQRLLPSGQLALGIPPDLQARALGLTGGFDLQASRRVRRGERGELERLFRYLLHPPLSHERLQLTDDGRVRLLFSRPWRDGTSSLVVDPLNFIARLVPLVPAPGVHQVRYHGVLAPRSALRAEVIPERPADGAQLSLFTGKGEPTRQARPEKASSLPKAQRISWARLLKRMGGYEMESCPDCGHRLVIVSAVLDAVEIRRVLTRIGQREPVEPLTQSPSRGPPPSSGQLSLDLLPRGSPSGG